MPSLRIPVHRWSPAGRVLALAGAIAGFLPAQDVATLSPSDVARERLATFCEARGVPGATAAFVLPDGTRGAVAVGLADVEAERAMRPEDRMMSGSVGKVFFATVILLAVEDGELDLDAPVAKWLGEEEWFGTLPNAEDLTLRALLRHRSGIPEHVQSREFIAACRADPDKEWKPEELLAYVAGRDPLFAVGEGFGYADTNYIVAGVVYERATGRRIYDAVRARLLEPLELRDTVPSVSRTIEGLVPGYGMEGSPFGLTGKLVDEEGRFAINPQMEWTGGGFALTTRDLARFGHALYTGEVLPDARLREMFDTAPAGRLGRYGIGVIERESALGKTYGHSGWFPGYLCELAHYVEPGITVAVQVNTDDLRKVGRLVRLADEVAVGVRDSQRSGGEEDRRDR